MKIIKSQKGFTLFELIFSLLIMAMVTVIVLIVINTGMKLFFWKLFQAQQNQNYERLFNTIQTDFKQIDPRSVYIRKEEDKLSLSFRKVIDKGFLKTENNELPVFYYFVGHKQSYECSLKDQRFEQVGLTQRTLISDRIKTCDFQPINGGLKLIFTFTSKNKKLLKMTQTILYEN